jgi:hypothetical protein
MRLPDADLYVHRYNSKDALTSKWLQTGSGQQASLAMDSQTGEFAISWADGSGPGIYPQIHLQAFSSTATPSNVVQVTTNNESYNSNSSVAINKSGEIVVGWLNTIEGSTYTYSIQEQNFTYNGTTLSTKGAIATVATVTSNVGELDYTTVALNDSGKYVVGFAYIGVQAQYWTIYADTASFGSAPPPVSLANTGDALFMATISAIQLINMDHYLALDDNGQLIYAYLTTSPPGSTGYTVSVYIS